MINRSARIYVNKLGATCLQCNWVGEDGEPVFRNASGTLEEMENAARGFGATEYKLGFGVGTSAVVVQLH